jgi:protein-S-isoprenylcysteine O-methyltransferase Ste14
LLVATGVGLGGASLMAFALFLFVGSYQAIDLGLTPGEALAWDGLLSLLFFVQHSAMVRQSFRRRLGRMLPAEYHAAVYSAASGLVLLLVLGLWQTSGPPLLRLEGLLRLVAQALFLLSLLGFGWGVRSLGFFDPFGSRSAMDRLRGVTRQEPPLTLRGPYRLVRHPLYTFTLGLIWLCPTVTADRLLLDLLWSAWIAVGCRLEERDLAAQFGEGYRAYQRDVPMLLPRWPKPGG